MILFELSEDTKELLSGSCVSRLRDLTVTGLTYRQACTATKSYRELSSLLTSLPAIFIGLPKTVVVDNTQVNVAGYWLYNAVFEVDGVSKTGFISVPAQSVGENLPLLVTQTNPDTPNPRGLEIIFSSPCPPPTPCPIDDGISSNDGYSKKFS